MVWLIMAIKSILELIHSVEFAVGNNHINGIENFCGFCKVRLTKFRGIRKNNFNLQLKNANLDSYNRDKNIYKMLLKIFRKIPHKLDC